MQVDLTGLNGPQREAVECVGGPLLVLAGAGSGKTRVLTYRIAHMVEDVGIDPWEILAITFTNKAAAEMRERLSSLIGSRSRGMWVSTFHSMCLRILKQHAELLGFTKSFTIYDADDQKKLVKTVMVEIDVNPKVYAPNAVLGRISQAKNDLLVPGEFEKQVMDPVGRVAARVYERYQKRLRASNAMDFDDLLLYAYLLLKHHPGVLEAYQNRFRHIMVDEYQDTNHAQYSITTLLAAKWRNIMVVGDDDQSIYSWRGADISNILDFEKDYPEAKVVKLEQNYRSTGNILDAANAVIKNNGVRKEKRLFTDSGAGDKIGVYMAPDERDEGRWIAGEIEKLKDRGESYSQMAVFYRTNAQSRILEDMLIRAGIPYRIVGGTKFFDRKEIRDVMAYLSLVVNPADDLAVERVINVPRRGIGKTTLERMSQTARERGISLLESAELLLVDDEVRPQVKRAIGDFCQMLREASGFSGDLRKVVERIVEMTGMIEAYRAEDTDEAQSRIENIQEFFGVVTEFMETHEDSDALYEAPAIDAVESAAQGELEPKRELHGDSLADFIEWVRLRTDLDAMEESGSSVTLMTIHSAKGLEFDDVFVAGMEEGIFPHINSSSEASGVEEERRLAYVAITRARKRLSMTCAQTRQLYGSTSANPVSRFIGEIPSELRNTMGLGSSGFSGSGWEKRGSRRGISGSGREAGRGAVSYVSSSSASRASRTSAASGRTSGSAGRISRRSGVSFDGKRAGARVKFAKGDRLDHKTFGRGVVLKVDGDTIHVKFDKSGQVKKLLKDYAPIVKI